MKLEQSFTVSAPLERVWEALIDVERVAPCLPGASVVGRNDDGSYNGEFKVKVGPTSAAYAGKLKMEDVDAGVYRATMSAAGTDTRGSGGASATIVSTASAAGEGETTVAVSTDYHITGRLARFGRGGMIEAISNRLLGEFAGNLQAMLAGGEAPAGFAGPAQGAAGSAAPPPTESAADESKAVTETSGLDDPDGAINGASPVADRRADEPAAASAAEPLSAASLVGSVVLARVKENAVALLAVLAGVLVGLGVARRRS
jgi:carbon monoxide dehydrogenase subunit G